MTNADEVVEGLKPVHAIEDNLEARLGLQAGGTDVVNVSDAPIAKIGLKSGGLDTFIPGFWRDAQVPLLTKVYQAKTDADLNNLLFAMAEKMFRKDQRLGAFQRPGETFEKFWAEDDPERPDRIAELRDVCICSQRIMAELCDNRRVSREDLHIFNDLFSKYASRLIALPPMTFLDDTSKMYIPVEQIQAAGTLGGGHVDASEILLALNRLMTENQSLGRCQECGSVFIVKPDKPTHRFCSDRCAERSSKKHQRSEKKTLVIG
jgi:hypothetical protein